MATVVDLMHLLILAAGIGIGAWALIALRRSVPRGRFVIFSTASVGALFGCAAMSGEVGLISPQAWAAVAVVFMAAVVAVGYRFRHAPAEWR